MLSIHRIAGSSARYLVERLPAGQRRPRVEVVAFGLEVALGGLLQLLVFSAAGWYLGLLPELLAALITMASYRLLAGGVHSRTYYGCLLLSLVTLVLLAGLGRGLAAVLGGGIPLAAVMVCGAGLAVARRWAPAATAAAPIVNPRRRVWLKKATYLWLGGWLAVVLTGHYLAWPRSLLIASILALVVQSFFVTPAGFTLLGRVDAALERLLPLG